MQNDFIQRFIFDNLPIRGAVVRLNQAWKPIVQNSQTFVAAEALLARVVTASVLMTSNLKFKGTLSLQLQSEGSARLILGQCTHTGKVRGVARPNAEHPDRELLENSLVMINLEPERGEPYQGIVSIQGSEVEAALESYFAQSEQLPTRFWLAYRNGVTAGLMVQKMPGECSDSDDWNRVVKLASTVAEGELLTLPVEQLLYRLYHEEQVRMYTAKSIQFECSCSRSKVTSTLRALGEKEVRDLVVERGQLEVTCEYCGVQYAFDRLDVDSVFEVRQPTMPGPKTLQ